MEFEATNCVRIISKSFLSNNVRRFYHKCVIGVHYFCSIKIDLHTCLCETILMGIPAAICPCKMTVKDFFGQMSRNNEPCKVFQTFFMSFNLNPNKISGLSACSFIYAPLPPWPPGTFRPVRPYLLTYLPTSSFLMINIGKHVQMQANHVFHYLLKSTSRYTTAISLDSKAYYVMYYILSSRYRMYVVHIQSWWWLDCWPLDYHSWKSQVRPTQLAVLTNFTIV